jgi:hypothetical protein
VTQFFSRDFETAHDEHYRFPCSLYSSLLPLLARSKCTTARGTEGKRGRAGSQRALVPITTKVRREGSIREVCCPWDMCCTYCAGVCACVCVCVRVRACVRVRVIVLL